MSAPGPPLLTVRDLRSYLATSQGVVRAVDGVSLTVHEAEVLGIVGESGCGKTVTCRTIMGLMAASSLHASGEVIYHPHGERSILNAPASELRALRGAHLAMIFQDPMTARMLQRVLIAIALASSPRLLLADEPTTSLDVIIQDQILSLLLELQEDTGMSMILVSHDLAVITEVCDRIVVMYAGQVVEEGATADIITDHRHPYNRALLDALPQEGQRGPLRSIGGSPPSLIDVPEGCRFAPRCRHVVAKCRSWDTELLQTGQRQQAARCWRQEEIGHEIGRSQA